MHGRNIRKTRLIGQSGLYGVLLLGLLSTSTALAQTAPETTKAPETKPKASASPDATTPKPQDKATTDTKSGNENDTLTVTGQKPLNRIDRQTYDNTKDADSKTGTALDALAKVPGVAVDPSGSVTLRGKSPEILINGRPAPELQGDNRAAALQGMSSGSITSIEVMNNPGAQYGSGTSSSVINLVTTAVIPAGGFVSAQLQSTGGYNLSGNGHIQFGKLSLNGFLSTGNTKQRSQSGSGRRSLDANGQTVRSNESNGRSTSDGENAFARFSADYQLSKKDVLSGGFVYTRFVSDNENNGYSVIYNTAGNATDIYTTDGDNDIEFENKTASLTWSHTGAKAGETLKVDWRATEGLSDFDSANLLQYSRASVPGNLAGYQSLSKNKSKTHNQTFSVDYNVPVGNDQFTTGLQITSDTSETLTLFSTIGTVTNVRNSAFDYDQTISAVYATYQKPFGDHWTVLGGLRIEQFELDGKAPLVNLSNHVSYTSYNPSLFATYVISANAKVRLNYSHRLQRPQANSYNPQTIQTSETNISVGQTNLKPQETDSYEAGYEYSNKGTSYQLRGYSTRETGIVIFVSTFVPDPLNLGNLVLRTGRQNAGTRDTVGTEFNFSGKLTPKLSVNMNGNLASVSLDTPNFKGTKSVTGLTGRASFNYQLTTNDRVSVNYSVSPRTLDTQGYRLGYSTVGLQYSRKLSKTSQLTLVVNDVARSSKTKSFSTTPTVEGFSISSRQAPTAYISLSRSFGGAAASRTAQRPSPNPAGAASPTGTTNPGGVTIIRQN